MTILPSSEQKPAAPSRLVVLFGKDQAENPAGIETDRISGDMVELLSVPTYLPSEIMGLPSSLAKNRAAEVLPSTTIAVSMLLNPTYSCPTCRRWRWGGTAPAISMRKPLGCGVGDVVIDITVVVAELPVVIAVLVVTNVLAEDIPVVDVSDNVVVIVVRGEVPDVEIAIDSVVVTEEVRVLLVRVVESGEEVGSVDKDSVVNDKDV